MVRETNRRRPDHRVPVRDLAGDRPKGREPLRLCMMIESFQGTMKRILRETRGNKTIKVVVRPEQFMFQ